MTKEKSSLEQDNVLDEIIKYATGLPLDRQEVLLTIVKSMRYTRECVMRECDAVSEKVRG